MKHIIITIVLTLQVCLMYGQETYKEVKSLTKSLEYKTGQIIDISGERTFINIQVADQSVVTAEVEIISRYKEQSQAQIDLEKIQVVFEKKGNTIYFSNAIQIQDITDKPKSNIKTVLNLTIPRYTRINIRNAFGDITIKGKIDEINLESQFCTIEVTDYTGKFTIESKYDEFKLINSNGEFKINGDKSDVSLDKVSGEVKADVNFGKLDIIYGDNPLIYDITSEYTPISIYLSPRLDIYHDYTCKKCELITEYCDETVSRESSGKTEMLTIGTKGKSESTIEAQSEDINIISINTQVNNK